MRIGVMLRTMDERQGIGIYTQNLMDEMLSQDRENEYVLWYRSEEFLGRYERYDHVKEKVVRGGNKILWDQVLIPLEARREKVDLIFHTKFTVPLFTGRRTVMSIHGASWFVHPELYGKLDVAYIRMVMPLYCRKAAAIVSNSELTTNDYVRILNVPPEKITTAHLGTSENFRMIGDEGVLVRARTRYGLPGKFILSVVKYDPRKNFENLIAAFRILRKTAPAKLVVIGIGCEKYREEYRLDADGTSDDVTFLGWVDNADLPAIYNLAHCLFFPSVYEEFGIPTCEAMACGCPPVVSKTGALPELADGAGIIVDPFNPEEMAEALKKMYTDDSMRSEYAARSLERAREFTWKKCAEKTLQVIHSL
ncbi:MAG: glycosyltransferase family 4 protein [Verrucomicrobia bacterium]|nr:glycosyltransferase family 4 protein [Verrucomicrobiota bacterium]